MLTKLQSKAVFLNTLTRRYGDMPQVPLNESDMTAVGSLRCKPTCFKAECGASGKDRTVVNASDIVEATSSWSHVATKTLTRRQCGLIRALLQVDRALWGMLWLCQFLVPAMIVTKINVTYLILAAFPDIAFAAELVWDDVELGYFLDPGKFATDLYVTDWAFTIHDYAVRITNTLKLIFVVDMGQRPLDFILRNTITNYSACVVRKV